MHKRDFIDLRSFSREELEQILLDAEAIKSGQKDVSQVLSGKTLGMLFSVASTRTRLSFLAGTRQMGGHAEYLNTGDLQLKNRETVTDTAKVMDRFLDGLIVRMYDMKSYGSGREALETIAANTSFPVINALDDKDHPCQVMSDVLTIKEQLGPDFRKKKVLLTWGFAQRQKSPGVTHSMMSAAALLGMNLEVAFPEGFEPDEAYINFAKKQAALSGGRLSFSHNMMAAAEGADVIYVKSWKALNLSDEDELAIKNSVRADWCLSSRHFEAASQHAVYMDCLPSIRGEEVTAEVKDGPRSIIFDEAGNRLYMQKAIMNFVFEKIKAPHHIPLFT
ncbi:ornithine carbamoyltransferase [Chitinophaga polysaccharea]|uniref:ornithine carbamoyltransferase n=1 Tax=Chitinophaga polysaccharea TaxID=1293035 RepID=UPI001455062B|nr:ornithine carbamoyltransferase [Chitinophaga polysaccharea]NLR57665.1 ornithine carbamoyltransferase [Chitinophaga polysaccharea]